MTLSQIRRCLLAAVITIFAVGIGPACAEIDDGNSLYRYCNATAGAFVMYCFGYVDSIVNDMRIFGSVDGFSACLPSDFGDNRRRDIIVTFLERHPGDRDSPATELIAHAFADAFPCSTEPSH
jgi:hypothetical protein